MKKYLFIALILLFKSGLSQQVTLQTLLNEMIDEEAVVRWPEQSYGLKQASSYDRRSVSPEKPGWFANTDQAQFIRTEERGTHKEHVMFDAVGPGAIVRFWLTTNVKPGTMRFYFDRESSASIEIPAYDLMKAGFNLGPALLNPHSSYEPNGKGGNTLYLPIPYEKHCKITWEDVDTLRGKQAKYYQINYRIYSPATRVKTFKTEDLVTEKALIDKVESVLWHPKTYAAKKPVTLNKTIAPGKEISLQLPQKPSAVRSIIFNITTPDKEHQAQVLRSTVLKIVFDGETTVWCPVGDFSGSGVGGRIIKSWYREADSPGKIISRWVMPYKQKATVSLINTSDWPVNATVSLNVDDWRWNNSTMYFHAAWKHEINIKDTKWDYDVTKVAKTDTAGPIDWNFSTITGRGVYLGNTLAVFNHMHTWYGEGDAKIWVDKDDFPSEFGTGLEDYYNTSWAPVVLYQTPFANAPRADNPDSYGHNTFTRTRILDRVAFRDSFRYDMEMLSWETGRVDCAATVYWYGFAGAKDNGTKNKEVPKQPLPVNE
ncbi:MAG: glycoside hydrolase family 172 protein [Segetibacter sp.]